MIKSDSALYSRYTMTHGELLLADKIEDSMPLRIVDLTLYSKLQLVERRKMEEDSFGLSLPKGAIISLQFRKIDGKIVTYSSQDVLQLKSDAILELRQAMAYAGKETRPIISYICSAMSLKCPARLMVAYFDNDWQCVLATCISYVEVHFVYELLSKYGLITQKNPT